jgi:hypothetical protein
MKTRTTSYRGYKIVPSGDNFLIHLNNLPIDNIPAASRKTAKKWIDMDIIERRQNAEWRAKLKKTT